jgi:hypothetical protein
MSEFLTDEDLKTIAVPKIETVTVTELGGKKVKIKALTALEVLRFYKAHTQRGNEGKEQHHMAAFLSQAICREDGTPFFASMDAGMDFLLDLPYAALLEMQTVATRLNPLSMEELEKRAKNSQAPDTKSS